MRSSRGLLQIALRFNIQWKFILEVFLVQLLYYYWDAAVSAFGAPRTVGSYGVTPTAGASLLLALSDFVNGSSELRPLCTPANFQSSPISCYYCLKCKYDCIHLLTAIFEYLTASCASPYWKIQFVGPREEEEEEEENIVGVQNRFSASVFVSDFNWHRSTIFKLRTHHGWDA